MIKTKKQMLTVVVAFVMMLMLGTVTYAFFNYTRTGTANTIKTGKLAFTTSQSGTINLTNVFPITRTDAGSDTDNSDEVVITITGDTTYPNGIEYVVSLEDVNIETSTNKKIPIGIIVTPEKTGELGTANSDYFDDGERGGDTSYYKVLAGNTVKEGEYVLVGYIRPGESEVNGTIGIKAFIDKDSIAISDTYDPINPETDNMGTTTNWVNGRTVLTTTEWNSLQGNNSISFKVRVQANEGIWVGEPLSRNNSVNISSASVFTSEQKSSITEINFIRMSEEMINTHNDAIDITSSGGEGVVKAWIDGTKLYIASPGETYLPENSAGYLSSFSNITKINFNNINTSEVENMYAMFAGNNSLSSIDLTMFDTSNVENMSSMFASCGNLTTVDLSYLDTSNLVNMSTMFAGANNLKKVNLKNIGSDSLDNISNMFGGCLNLEEINMSGFNFGTANMGSLFSNLTKLTKVNLKNANTSQVLGMDRLFQGSTSLTNIDLSGLGSSSITSVSSMFSGCSSLRVINMSGFNFGTSVMAELFKDLSNLETIILSGANTSNVSNMASMFSGCSSLTSVDLSGLGGNSLWNVGGMFYGCSNLREINMSGFNFGTATLSGFFSNSTTLETVNLSNANLSNVTTMPSLFQDSTNLASIDLSGVSLNNSVTTPATFYGCSSLKTIYVSNNTDWSNISSSNMFSGCTSLVGGMGTTYDANNITSSYAKVDGGQSNPGYFTIKTN